MELVSITHPDLTDHIDFSPDANSESWRLKVPAKGACYVLEDSGGRPILLAATADLRRALLRRVDPSVWHARWRIVCSRFEADWVYVENARSLLPGSYKRLVEHWSVHWVCVDPDAEHPRFIASERPVGDPHWCFGPLPDAKAARRVVEMLEDVFDLCRYHPILVKAPHGQACAYKQMGRCPAPCDGTVTMESYREQVRRAVEFLGSPRESWVEATTVAMKTSAENQRFENASRLKRRLERVRATDSTPLSPLAESRWLILQSGDRKGSARAFFVVPGTIEFAGQIDVKERDALLPRLVERAAALLEQAVTASDAAAAAERVALVGWHLLHADRTRGAFIPLRDAIDVARVGEAVGAVANKKTSEGAEVIECESTHARISETTRPG